ncbi:MAG TPA: helix-turn-helix domain-containing protein [Candidatus Saccharimonadales bacterium]|nr:helix-turn-helix domain-containing protein [Candidatus Saccharimonadales bacterium]
MTQKEALEILKTGNNVFLTGEPGSGKTYTINEYVKYLRSNGVEPAITASTGIAATHIGGLTIHSWSGIGIKSTLTKSELANIVTNSRVANRIKKTKVLIIDEISMLSAETFTTVERVCRAVRTSKVPGSTQGNQPFGGLQVVLVGDFFQLPPVTRRPVQSQESTEQSLFGDEVTSLFAFASPAWKELDPTVCYLLEQHRQDDLAFLGALNAIRRNELTNEARATFTARIVTALPAATVTKLFPHNANVDQLNETELGKLTTISKSFAMNSRGAPPLIDSLKRNCLSPETLTLKVGAKVMFTKNHQERQYVNGTLGEIIGFNRANSWPIIKTRGGKVIVAEPAEWAIDDGGKVLAAISQFPLRLAWAITVHKSQGMSLDAAVMDLRQAFEFGQGYVALSRVRTLDGLYLLGFNERALEVHPEVSAEDAKFREASMTAVRQLQSLDPTVLIKRQANFVKACGGGPGAEPAKAVPKIPTQEITRELLIDQKMTPSGIAKHRGMTFGTIIGHLEKLVEDGKIVPAVDLAKFKPKTDRFQPIKTALLAVKAKEGQMFLSQARERLGNEYSFDEIRTVRLFL